VTDIIDRIDEITAPTCGWCQTPLRPDGAALDFCGELCQGQWTLRCAGQDDTTLGELSALRSRTPRIDSEGARYATTVGPIPSAAAVPSTAVLIGGQHHGQTIGIPQPPRSTLEIIEAVAAPYRFDRNSPDAVRVAYQLKCHNGVHWCYVDPRPAAPQRTVHVEGREPLTIDYHHYDEPRDVWWVTITGRHRGVLCEVTGELLANGPVSAWFAERSRDHGWPTTEGGPA
jgi:hypothetical protein